MPDVEIAVVVASHNRALRLRWLLNALQEQTLPRDLWEVVVGHDSGDETEELLRSHPLAREGKLRHVRLAQGTAPPGANRNAAWRITEARFVTFTDDDCRPPPDWLANALEAARAHPDSIVQGMTMPDPDDDAVVAGAPYKFTQWIVPPTIWSEACNIVYPRTLLDALGGFDERYQVGEDADLAIRARARGASHIGDRGVLTYHAAVESSLAHHVRTAFRWTDFPWLVKRHPELRDQLFMWVFWKRSHAWLPFALAGVHLSRRNLAYGVLAVPYLITSTPVRGQDPRGRLRELTELPGTMLVVGAEFLALARGSVRHRTVCL